MQNKTTPRVGYGKASISPDWPIGLSGYGTEKNRISIGNKTDIFAIALAVTDSEGKTALLISLDSAAGDENNMLRPMIREKFGIPEDHVIISSIHPHSTPIWTEEYCDLLKKQVAIAVERALKDRSAAEGYIAHLPTVALNFVRNYVCNDGSFWSPNFGDRSSGLKCHESEADGEMRLVKFQREGKTPVILVNFQAHPLKGASGSDPYIHADWPGIMRHEVSARLGADVIYFSGAGGNLDSTGRLDGENVSEDWIHHGRRAAETVLQGENHYRKVKIDPIRVKELTKTYETDHSMDHLVSVAKPIFDLYVDDFEKAKALAATVPQLHSVYHAKSIVLKSLKDKTMEMTIGAIAMGDLAFTVHPYEMFDTNGKDLRDGTVGNPHYKADEQMENPFPMTVVCTLANGHIGYVPSHIGFANGGYSTDITRLAPGGGERLVGDYLKILRDLYERET